MNDTTIENFLSSFDFSRVPRTVDDDDDDDDVYPGISTKSKVVSQGGPASDPIGIYRCWFLRKGKTEEPGEKAKDKIKIEVHLRKISSQVLISHCHLYTPATRGRCRLPISV